MRPTIFSFLTLLVLTVQASAAPPHHAHPHKMAKRHVSHVSAVPMTWNAQMANFLSKCDPSINAAQITRVVNDCSAMLSERGITESPLSVLVHVNGSVPRGLKLGTHPQDVFAAYVTMREDG